MPHGKQSRKNASGAGTIRKKTVRRGGREYTYWEARYTVGFDPGTGRQKQKSVTGRTQKEVAQKLREVTVELDRGTYQEPCKMTLGQWLDIWQKDYLNSVKPRTVDTYRCEIENHIRPELGGIRLEALNTHTIQGFYNRLTTETPKRGQKTGLSPKTVKNVHGVLHKALQQAVAIGYLRFNPADACSLPRVERQELKPLDEASIGQFIAAVRGHPYEAVFLVTLFTGLRQGEVLGLTWECVDFAAGTVLISKQLQKMRTGDRGYYLASTKSGKSRKLTPRPLRDETAPPSAGRPGGVAAEGRRRLAGLQAGVHQQTGRAPDAPHGLSKLQEGGRVHRPARRPVPRSAALLRCGRHPGRR